MILYAMYCSMGMTAAYGYGYYFACIRPGRREK